MIANRYVVADVHGCINTLTSLIEKISPTPDDEIYFLGDYIDRGPESKKVVDYIINLKKQLNVTCLKGNHEELYEESEDAPYGFKDISGNFVPQYSQFWKDLKYYIELEDAILVHASINFNSKWPFHDKVSMLWRASKSMYSGNNTGKRIIRGHSRKKIDDILYQVSTKGQVISLDNGCYRNITDYKYLCCIELNSLSLIIREFCD
jgi:serine/threonine protein phosphatase 1